jgi:hypothetical protein
VVTAGSMNSKKTPASAIDVIAPAIANSRGFGRNATAETVAGP